MAEVVGERRERHSRIRSYLPILLCMAVLGTAIGTAYALTVMTIRLAGITVLEFTDEARVEDVIIFDEHTVVAVIAPTDKTQADKTYTVRIYLDGVASGEATISWTADEIAAGVKKVVVFTDLNLSDVSYIQVEVLG